MLDSTAGLADELARELLYSSDLVPPM